VPEKNIRREALVKSCARQGGENLVMRGAGSHADARVDGVERIMKVGDGLDLVGECRKQRRSPFKIVGLSQRPSELPLDLGGRIVCRAPEKPLAHLFG
jgi:hypothetical protein